MSRDRFCFYQPSVETGSNAPRQSIRLMEQLQGKHLHPNQSTSGKFHLYVEEGTCRAYFIHTVHEQSGAHCLTLLGVDEGHSFARFTAGEHVHIDQLRELLVSNLGRESQQHSLCTELVAYFKKLPPAFQYKQYSLRTVVK